MQFNTSNILLILVLISIFGVVYWYIKMSKKLIDFSRKQKQKKKIDQEKYEELLKFEEEIKKQKPDSVSKLKKTKTSKSKKKIQL